EVDKGTRVESNRRNVGVIKVEVLILHLCRPVRREHVFETAAHRVAGVITIDAEIRIKERGDHGESTIVTEPDTTLGINESRPPRITETACDRSKPVAAISESADPIRKGAIAVRKAADLAFNTDHPVRSELIVSADLTAAQERSVTIAGRNTE